MAYNIRIKTLIISFVLVFLSTTFMFSQESQSEIPENAILLDNGTIMLEDGTIVDAVTLLPLEEKDYTIQETDEGVVFIQTLSWQPSEFALRYEIIIEKQEDDGTWIPENTYETEEGVSEVEVSLFAGTYRYKVFVYNFLDLQEAESDWFEISVFKAIQPTVTDLSPSLIYLDEVQTGIFSFSGSNALENTLFYLELPNEPSRTVFGDIIEQDDGDFRIQFDMNRVDVGSYVFTAENPGGLTSKIDPFEVKFLKPYDLDVTVGYNVMYTFPGDIPLYFEKEFYPFGLSAKVTYIPLKRNWGQIGPEISAHWFLMKGVFDVYDVSSHVLPVTLNFVYQLPLIKKRLVMDTHVGVGTTFLLGTKFVFSSGVESPAENAVGIAASAGLAFQGYILNRLYVELGADYIATFYEGTLLHLVAPALSVGWQF